MTNNRCTCDDPSTYPMDPHDEAYLNKCGYCLERMWDAAQPKINDYKGKIIVSGSSGKGIIQQMQENEEFESMDSITQEQFDNFLDDLIESREYPDDMEIFTSDRGWHKVKDRR